MGSFNCNRTAFCDVGYRHLTGVVDLRTCELATQYAKFSMIKEFSPEGVNDQVPGAHASYADPLMETLLVRCQPNVERATGLKLIPTYSYYRVYRPGDALAKHLDRPSCEVSLTLCLGCNLKGVHGSYGWPIFLATQKGAVGGAPGTAIRCDPGDGVVYMGCDVEHWREPMRADEGSYQIQAFFHYVHAAGQFAELCRFDARPALGLPRTARDIRRLQEAAEVARNIRRSNNRVQQSESDRTSTLELAEEKRCRGVQNAFRDDKVWRITTYH